MNLKQPNLIKKKYFRKVCKNRSQVTIPKPKKKLNIGANVWKLDLSKATDINLDALTDNNKGHKETWQKEF